MVACLKVALQFRYGPFDGTRCQDQLFSGEIRKRYVNEDEFTHSECPNNDIVSWGMTSPKTSNVISTVFCFLVPTRLVIQRIGLDIAYATKINRFVSTFGRNIRKWKEQG
jgi:hypothetical protein